MDGIADEVVAQVPTEIKIAITSSPTRGIEATLRVCEELARHGFRVAPHLAARAVRDEKHLQDILEAIQPGVRRAVAVIDGEDAMPLREQRDDFVKGPPRLGEPVDQ